MNGLPVETMLQLHSHLLRDRVRVESYRKALREQATFFGVPLSSRIPQAPAQAAMEGETHGNGRSKTHRDVALQA